MQADDNRSNTHNTASASHKLLKQPLTTIFEFVKAQAAEKPPREPPAGMRPIIKFTNLPANAMLTIKKTVETDADFRSYLCESLTSEQLDTIGWLWLRGDGDWHKKVVLIARKAELEKSIKKTQKARYREEQKLPAVEQTKYQASKEVTKSRARLSKQEKQSQKAERQFQAKQNKLQAFQQEVTQASQAYDDQNRLSKQAQSDLSKAYKKVKHREGQIEKHRKTIRSYDAQITGDVQQLAQLEAEELAALSAVEILEEELTPGLTSLAGYPRSIDTFSVEDVENFLRTTSDLLVLVDGYNIAFKLYDQELTALEDIRHHLQTQISNLSARLSRRTRIVWDGDKHTKINNYRFTRSDPYLEIAFSEPGIEADDVIINACKTAPNNIVYAVVSGDKKVRSACKSHGAYLLKPYQYISLL